MSPRKNALYSAAALAVAAVIATALVLLKPDAETAPPTRPVTTIEAVTAQPDTVLLTVQSQGTVQPRVRTRLAAEVGGLVTELSPNFREGGFIRKGEVLVRIDMADFRAAAASRQAELATARLALEEEKARAEQARLDWDRLGEGEAGPLTLREPQLEQANARLESAQAALEKANRDLERTAVRAPYDGRVEAKFVDLGQVISPGPANPLAEIYAADTAEVRLPVSDREAGFLDLSSLDGDLASPRTEPPAVTLAGSLKGRPHTWQGQVVRTEAAIDPRTRFLFLVAEVEDGFVPGKDGAAPPLKPGLFVRAEITGRSLEGAVVLPRYALRSGNRVYVVTGTPPQGGPPNTDGTPVDGYLYAREVEIAQTTRESVIITSGLAAGEQVATSPIAWFVEGMPVRLSEAP